MSKQNLKDNAAQIIVIVLAVAIIYGVNEFTANDSFYRNTTGLSFELVGFLVMLWSSFANKGSNWQSKVRHPKTFQTGIALVSLGLLFQLMEIICTESPVYCTNS